MVSIPHKIDRVTSRVVAAELGADPPGGAWLDWLSSLMHRRRLAHRTERGALRRDVGDNC